jgi:hypothetical protein
MRTADSQRWRGNWYEKQSIMGSISNQFLLWFRGDVVQYGSRFRHAGTELMKNPGTRGGWNEEEANGEEGKSAQLARCGLLVPGT